jgi:hypothetical protein
MIDMENVVVNLCSRDIGVDVLHTQNINEIELTLSESEGQSATFRFGAHNGHLL